MPKILNTIGEVYTTEAKPILEAIGDVDYVTPTQEELLNIIGAYDYAIVGLGLRFDAAVLKQAPKLKAIGTATTGLDHIDLEQAEIQGINILSLKNEREFLNTITGTAELAFALMLDVMRGISPAFESVKSYQWNREAFRGFEAKHKRLGIIGCGRLGAMMARYGNGFLMDVVAYDPHLSDKEIQAAGATPVSLNELLETSDVVSLHVHLSDETKHLIDEPALKNMKSTAYVVNTARGGIVDEEAMLWALQEKEIAGYATDVLADELTFHDTFAHHPLVEYAKQNNNVIIVPHIGGMVAESRIATDVFIAEKLRDSLTV